MTLLARRPAPVPHTPSAPHRPYGPVLALAAVEARRLLRHPLVLLALTGHVALLLRRALTGSDYPVLQVTDRETQYGPTLIGLAVLLAANAAVARSRRHGTDAQFGVLVLPVWRRTAAHLLSVLPAALVVAALVAGEFAREALRPGAVGHASVAELATGPAVVALLGVTGVALGRAVRSPLAAPLAVVGVLALLLGLATASGGGRWLAPIAFDEGTGALPSELVGRPAGWHVLYLAGLATVLGAVVVRVGGGRTRLVTAVAAVASAATLAGCAGQVMGPDDGLVAARERAAHDPADQQECVGRGPVTYCAFPEFLPWTDEWAGVVEQVFAESGTPLGDHPFTVRQRIAGEVGTGSSGGEEPAVSPGEVTVGTAWGGVRDLEFAAGVAREVVVRNGTTAGVYCDARAVVIAWLAVSAVPDGPARFESSQERQFGGGAVLQAPGAAVPLRDRETAVVRALFDLPADGVGERVRAHWAELTAPGASTDDAARLLGVPAPAETDADREWACV
ncbi:ABC transporter permease [Streptomyces sp. NPDC049879]|uniref:ABC transporter permease n=1 Tax=Streptomyces sp. NPDC049879 TaxID=3365598 RepID=UPI0037A55234